METVKMSFGQKGSLLFSSLNVLQLIGWTAVMIVSGAAAAGSIQSIGGDWVWSLVIGALIIVWLLIGLKNISKINIVAMGAVFILTIVMSTVIFRGHNAFVSDGSVSFGTAVELSAAMPLSWLPLISDYTRTAAKPKKATAISAIVYFIVSCWMYTIGMGAAVFTGKATLPRSC
jgi:purine-cytosine permease-like protein